MTDAWVHRRNILKAAIGLIVASGSLADAKARTASNRPGASSGSNPVSTMNSETLLNSQLRLGFELIRSLSRNGKTNSNFIVSPASLANVLAILELGASKPMRAALHQALGLGRASESAADANFAALRTTIASIAKQYSVEGPLRMANLVAFDPSSRPFPLAVLGLTAAGADVWVESLSHPSAIAKLNDWVSRKTSGLIPEILGEAPEDLGLVAINALHFKDRWSIPFEPNETAPAVFHSRNGRTGEVPLMHSRQATYAFRQNAKFVAAELSYATEGYKLVVVTTKSGTAGPSEFGVVRSWLGGQGFSTRPGEIALPRCRLSESAELLPALDALGLRSARTRADALSRFSNTPQHLARIVQKTQIQINEEGTEAAAATAAMTTRSIYQEYVKMVVDRPFVFALRDKKTGLVLLSGYVGRIEYAAGGSIDKVQPE